MNHTNLVLIPKKQECSIPADFRPISPCNVTYMVAKILASRLRSLLNGIISPNQMTFVRGRQITHKSVVAQVLTHSMGRKSCMSRSFALKQILTKAYDKVESSFLLQALSLVWLPHKFIELVRAFISTSTVGFSISEGALGFISPERGL